MALAKLAKINEHSSWAAWNIEETDDSLIRKCHLDEKGLTEWRTIRHPTKRSEWLGSRAALAALMQTMDIPLQPTYKDHKGKPFLQNNAYHISLANSYPYGVAILHRHQAVGIDIERPSATLQRIQHKFLNDAEIADVGDCPSLRCIYWCVKESLYKLYGRKQLSLKDNIVVHSVRFERSIQATSSMVTDEGRTLYHLEGIIIDGFFVVYSVI